MRMLTYLLLHADLWPGDLSAALTLGRTQIFFNRDAILLSKYTRKPRAIRGLTPPQIDLLGEPVVPFRI